MGALLCRILLSHPDFASGLAKAGSSSARPRWAVVEKSAQAAPEARVVNTELGGQGCSALPDRLYEYGWSCHTKQHREVVEPARPDLFQQCSGGRVAAVPSRLG